MADIITDSKTVLVRLSSPAGDNRSIVLDNPIENIRLATIKQKFEPILAMKILLGNKGDNLTAVEYATVTNTRKIKLGDSDIVVTVSPNAFVFPPQADEATNVFTVTGSKPTAAYATDVIFSGTSNFYGTTYEIYQQSITVKMSFDGVPTSLTGNINIVTSAATVSIPITLQS